MSKAKYISRVIFNRTAHQELWFWLAKHPTKGKLDWPGWKWNGGIYKEKTFNCFACEYAEKTGNNCLHCPLDWENPVCRYSQSLFFKWEHASKKSHRTRTKLALEIANTPLKCGVRFK